MNILEFVLLVWLGIVALKVGVDVGADIWAEKRAEREARQAKIQEAETILYGAISKRLEERLEAQTVELNVVSLRSSKPASSGRHRLTAA